MSRFSLFWFAVVLVFVGLSVKGYTQVRQSRFAPALGNTQQITASYFDRDSAMLFAYDVSGTVVVWDTENMRPVRSFPTVPMDIWNPVIQPTVAFSYRSNVDIHANLNKFCVMRTDSFDNGKDGVYDIYGRVSGTHFHQSDTTVTTERIQLLRKDNGVVLIRSGKKPFYENGDVFWGALGVHMDDSTRMINLEQPGAVCLRLSPDESRIAVGYEWGGVEVFDMENLQRIFRSERPAEYVAREVNDILFLPNNSGIAYTYKYSSPCAVFVHEFANASPYPRPISLSDERASGQLAMALSPSGRYLAFAGRTTLDIYDLQTELTVFSESTSDGNLLLDMASNLHFLDDDMLLLVGKAQEDNAYQWSMRNSGAGLYKLDWKAGIRSANYAANHTRTGVLLGGTLAAAGDYSFRIHNFSGGYNNSWLHLVTPERLENRFLPYGLELSMAVGDFLDRNQLPRRRSYADTLQTGQQGYGLLIDDALPGTSWLAQPLMADSAVLLRIDSTQMGFEDFVSFTHLHGYTLKRIHSGRQLLIWQKRTGLQAHLLTQQIAVSDMDGQVLLTDTVQFFAETPYLFSKDGAWLAYRRSNAEIVYISTDRFDDRRVLQTGLAATTYMSNRIQFDGASGRLAFQQYNPIAPQMFTLVQVDLRDQLTDTLTAIPLRPLAFALTADFKHLALSYSFNVVDENLMGDSIRLARAASFGLRNEYKPTILHLDVGEDDYRAIPTLGGYPAMQLLVNDRRITALQQDGLLYYYNVTDTSGVVSHQLEGSSQSFFTDSCYFATEDLVPQINILSAFDYHPVGQQDVYYNRPHTFLQVFGNDHDMTAALYEKAYEKRLQQYDYDFSSSADGSASPRIRIDPAIGRGFHTRVDHLDIPVYMDSGTPVDRLYVTVNGYAVYGKTGMAVAAGARELRVEVPLDSGHNHIQLQAVSADLRYAPPVNLQYRADFTPVKKPRTLWVLAAGVSDYQDSTQRLQFAAKDAQDMTRVFAYKENYDTVIVRTLLNEQVQHDVLLSEIQKVSTLGKDDVFILYLAGHGLLDNDANFHYATYNMDFGKPAAYGLSYDVLMAAMEQLPVRNKLLLLDACHSGLVDRSMVSLGIGEATPEGTIRVQGARGGGVRNTNTTVRLREQDVFLFMQQTFSSLAYDNHVSVLSAALGNNLALENNRLQNGLFTYALIKGLGLAKATDRYNILGDMMTVSMDENTAKREYGESSTVTISQLQHYIQQEVQRLSRGHQVPSFILSSNADAIRFSEGSFPRYLYSFRYQPLEGEAKVSDEEKYKLFLDRYKERGQ